MTQEQYQEFVKTETEIRERLGKYNLAPGHIHQIEYFEKIIEITYRDYSFGETDDTTVSIPVSEFLQNDTDAKIKEYVAKQDHRRRVLQKWNNRKRIREHNKRVEADEKRILTRLQAKYGVVK